MEKEEIKKKIRKLFKQHPEKRLTYKQITRKFLQQSEKDQIASAINELMEEKILTMTDSRKLKLNNSAKSKKSGRIVSGVVDMTMSGNAYVITPDAEEDVFIPQKYINRAFDGDQVKVELFSKSRRQKLEGEIIEVVSRARYEFVGTFEKSENFGFVVPDKGSMPVDIFIPAENFKDTKDGDRVIVKITHWPDDRKNPYGEILESLGAVGINDVEMKTILVENGFPLHFPKDVMKEIAALNYDITEEEIKKRRDFRDVVTITIDPVDAKDFDDAISIQQLANGNWEVGIHIADVAHYVKPGTAIDKEARKRATSVYLVDRVLPMLPEQLSNIACSLRPNEEKFVFSSVFELDSEARVVNKWFGKSIINSNRRFTYEEVQEIIESGSGDFASEMLLLNNLAQKLRKEKFRNGAIAFETVEVKFHIDLEGVPLGVYVKERNESHMLVEDFMLLANKEVAEFVSKKKIGDQSIPFVYRVHDQPDMSKLEEFSKFAYKFGYQMKIDTPRQVSASINKLMLEIKGKPEQDLLEKLAIRSMAKAVYTTKNIGHYGLAVEFYTHFTSPIRRYPDVLVHRVLEHSIEERIGMQKQELEELCVHSSWMERKAMDAERESVKYKQVEFLEDKIGQVYDGVISGVMPYGLFTEIIENKCEGLVSTETMKEDDFVFDEQTRSLIGYSTGIRYQLGDKIKIKVIKTNLEKRQIDFALVSED